MGTHGAGRIERGTRPGTRTSRRAAGSGYRRWLLGTLLAAAFAPPGSAAPLSAQMSDSLRAVVQERLERLERRVGDSTGLLPDSLEEDTEDPTQDSTLLALLQLPGYGLVEYSSDAATFLVDSRRLLLLAGEGEARLVRDGRELSSDSAVVVDDRTGRMTTFGELAKYRPEDGNELEARHFIYDLDEQRGTAVDANTEMGAMMGNWRVSGTFPWVDESVSYGHGLKFTSCELDHPHYYFVANRAKHTPSGTLVARNVLVYFADVPVFWLPFLSQSTEQGRRSGLLPVRFSVNDIVRTSDSYSRRVSNIGYYWAINDYADAELGLDWWSGNYAAITGRVQYRWQRMFQDGRADFRQFWRDDGGSELAFNANYRWEISEREQMRMSAAYASSSSFVRQNSFDPREVTQSIDSEGGYSRRFDWGRVSVNANRKHYLSDDRKELTLPSVNLSIATIDLFQAPLNRARFYNNATFSASGSLTRSVRDLAPQDLGEGGFSFGAADTEALSGGFSGSLTAGALSISQNVNFRRNTTLGLPGDFFTPSTTAVQAGIGSVADLQRPAFFPHAALEETDYSADELTWSTRINYQRTLIGSTTITPNLSLSGRSIRSDTSSVGSGLIAAPRRVAFGAQLKSDIYGFYADRRVRHKLSPTFDYAYTPKTEPTEIQSAVFGPRGAQPRNEIVVGLNQTIEMRVGGEEEADSAAAEQPRDPNAGPRRLPQSRKINVLSWRTSAVTYDFEQAGELGHFTRGFADNLTMRNQLSSDLLRGFNVSIEHDLFDDSEVAATGGQRRFAPVVSSMNLSFSLNNRSGVFGWLGSLRRGGGADAEDEGETGAEDEGEQGGEGAVGEAGVTGDEAAPRDPADTGDPEAQPENDPFGTLDEEAGFEDDPTGFEYEDMGDATVVPGRRDGGGGAGAGRRAATGRRGGVGDWSASISYSLTRSRGVGTAGSQMLQTSLNFTPTEKWSVRWRSSYDVQAGVFNDHTISLQRNLHRWEADFSFRQTPTGNWSFVFEVALTDNRDLHFDYEQRAESRGGGQRQRR